MSVSGTTIGSQQTRYNEVKWNVEAKHSNQAGASSLRQLLDKDIPVSGAITDLPSTRPSTSPSTAVLPFWEYKYHLSSAHGLIIKEINAKHSQGAGTTEEVFEKIEFRDLKIFFKDGTSADFNIAAAFSAGQAEFALAHDGTLGSDKLYQRGLKLTLRTNVLNGIGICLVTLEMSIVFRGAKNDFDPGKVPVVMLAWPQLSFMWHTAGATKKVEKFMGSVKISVKNKMHSSHVHNGSSYDENIASFFTDTNDTKLLTRTLYYARPLASVSSPFKKPLGWCAVFDYTKLHVQLETEIVAVYGPGDGTKYTGQRLRRYRWLMDPASPGIRLLKAPRQGMYDNIHIHARMPKEDKYGNIQIHAPFCGHSCVHLHWRWSSTSSQGLFFGKVVKFMGWSPVGAYTSHNMPLVPPNQRIRVAVCNHSTNSGNDGKSHSVTEILNPAVRAPLDPLRKMIWYRAEIIDPAAHEVQVIMEQGIGWGYRYATHEESNAVKGLKRVLPDSLAGNPSPHQMNEFFEKEVYPYFRYKGGDNQVPEGTNTILMDGTSTTSMENL